MHSGIQYSRTGKGDCISNSKASPCSWHADKLHAMQEILFAKAECCKELRDALIESRDQKLVETVRSDRCVLTPSEAQTTKPIYYPGHNHLGWLLELVRAHLIKQIQNDKNSKKDDEKSLCLRHHNFGNVTIQLHHHSLQTQTMTFHVM